MVQPVDQFAVQQNNIYALLPAGGRRMCIEYVFDTVDLEGNIHVKSLTKRQDQTSYV